ncbi:MAG: CDP-glycerol--glycerophosphate glycerophosphotransferase [Ruminococcaceae bacterium]|nr:CDP-glycerol--glycerophosphate glycerophosphotransferase [Oscillospiraceae bacterium]
MRLYIDPGTGSMLFTILIGVLGAVFYSLRMLFIKLRFRLGGGKVDASQSKIPFVIFSDDKRYWNIFEPIVREMSARGKKVHYITSSPDDPALSAEFPGFTAENPGSENKVFTRLNFLNACIVFSTTPGLDVYQWKRSKDVDWYVHIPHTAGEIVIYRMFGVDYYDAIMTSKQKQVDDIRLLEKMRNLPEKECPRVGVPYLDEMAKRVEAAGPIPEHERTVLLAPTWGTEAMFVKYGGKLIEKLLETGYHIIVRPHPQSFVSEKDTLDELMKKFPNSEQLEWNNDRDNFDALRRSDILITDFSGVIYDFGLVHNKPVIYTEPKFDLTMYDAGWLAEDPEYRLGSYDMLPRIGVQLNDDMLDNLKAVIDECIEDEKYAESRRKLKEDIWPNYGEGAKYAADYLISKYEEITAEREGKK